MQRNPSANSANYSVRAQELELQIADATDALRRAEADLPRITQELEDALVQAERAVAESQKPIDAAKATFGEASTAADAARDAYQTAREEAEERQRALKGQISDQGRRSAPRSRPRATPRMRRPPRRRPLTRRRTSTPTPRSPRPLRHASRPIAPSARSRPPRWQSLAAAESDVREQTRASRLRFGAAIAGIIVVVALILVLVFVL